MQVFTQGQQVKWPGLTDTSAAGIFKETEEQKHESNRNRAPHRRAGPGGDPKEIRRTQRIRRGDPLEIFTTGDGEVIFKKYSPIGEMNAVAAQYTEVLSKSFALTALVTDHDHLSRGGGPRPAGASPTTASASRWKS